MEKIKQNKYIILIGLLVLGFTFYWFEFRPYVVKKSCFMEVAWRSIGSSKDKFFEDCLRKNGI